MEFLPSSKCLFICICSLNKSEGGINEYISKDSITNDLPTKITNQLITRREQIRQLVKRARELDWQGIALSKLEFNRNLIQGKEFGGNLTAEYMPAIFRYQGRFFQTLGGLGREELLRSKHHVLFISGLYGIIRPLENIQLYSCPVKPQVADSWLKDNLLTDVLAEYLTKYQITRVFDLTAIAAYRNLIDWSAISVMGVEILHCFDRMSSGDFSLIPFALFLKNFAFSANESDLLNIKAEQNIENIVFRTLDITQPGLPNELIQVAENEIPLLQSHLLSNVEEVILGGNPITTQESGSIVLPDEWRFSITSFFRKQCHNNKSIARIAMEAILEICKEPTTPRGDTIQPLEKGLKGRWRYRRGGYRIIYRPDKEKRTVFLLDIDNRDSVYD